MYYLKFENHKLSRSLFTLIIIGLFFNPYKSLSQPTKQTQAFDSIYFVTATQIANQDVNRALSIADSLYINNSDNLLKLKSLMLSSTLYQQKGDIKQAIEIAQQAFLLAKKIKNYNWQARISGFLSTQYRILEMYPEGEEFLSAGEKIIYKIENDQVRVLYKGLIYQEKAYYQQEYKDYEKAIKFAKTAGEEFKKLDDPNTKLYYFATNEELIARLYLSIEKWDLANLHYNNLKDHLDKFPQKDMILQNFLYYGLGKISYELGKMDEADSLLHLAEKYTTQSENLELSILVYDALSEYYYRIGKIDEFSRYKKLYEAAKDENLKLKRNSIDQYIKDAKVDNSHLSGYLIYLLISFLLLSASAFAFIIYGRRKRRKQYLKSRQIITNLRKERQEELMSKKESSENKDKIKSEKSDSKLVSDDLEKHLLLAFQKFEENHQYIDKEMSLAKLSEILKTNSKYVSYILNTVYKKNFNQYINELRIQYIIDKLENDKIYRKYFTT